MSQKNAIIIGAGPAGLTAAYELLKGTDVCPIVYEMTNDIGGISKTINYKGNRIDLGGHRFFSKSERVMKWWQDIFPVGDPTSSDKVMLVRNRLSRILFRRRFFDYPITLSIRTLSNLGPLHTLRIGASYLKARFFPQKEEKSLEDFLINRFGSELYRTFFRDYTEKVWGVGCDRIKPEWGAQRIKGLSISRAISHALKKALRKDSSVSQKGTETSLIERFLYPKFGPGQLWEEVARRVQDGGGKLYMGHRVVGIHSEERRITGVDVLDTKSGRSYFARADYLISSMPIRDLIGGFKYSVPRDVAGIANGLVYRDFMTVGVLLRRLRIRNDTKIPVREGLIPDNWIYVQEGDVKVGRLQVFNNWSPYMVADQDMVWMGLEYFCNEGDELWVMGDEALARFAATELVKIGMISEGDVADHVVIRMPKTYPAYFGTYDQFDVVRRFLDSFDNLFPVGRNGQHRYNNQDHSMLTAMIAVENIARGVTLKDNIWAVNTEDEYHEEKSR